mmetsp:Transcript_60957/g.146749  ORF Transcript_60957/g.146749 Transcript_60957/m.146749 type:complete len:291 (-) Transcript_60957:782-1654(-)
MPFGAPFTLRCSGTKAVKVYLMFYRQVKPYRAPPMLSVQDDDPDDARKRVGVAREDVQVLVADGEVASGVDEVSVYPAQMLPDGRTVALLQDGGRRGLREHGRLYSPPLRPHGGVGISVDLHLAQLHDRAGRYIHRSPDGLLPSRLLLGHLDGCRLNALLDAHQPVGQRVLDYAVEDAPPRELDEVDQGDVIAHLRDTGIDRPSEIGQRQVANDRHGDPRRHGRTRDEEGSPRNGQQQDSRGYDMYPPVPIVPLEHDLEFYERPVLVIGATKAAVIAASFLGELLALPFD